MVLLGLNYCSSLGRARLWCQICNNNFGQNTLLFTGTINQNYDEM